VRAARRLRPGIDSGTFPATFPPGTPVKSAFQFFVGRGRRGAAGSPPAVTLGVALVLSACSSTSYDVKVNAAAKPAPGSSVSYRIETSDPALDPSSLRYKEAENYVKTALSGKGLYEAPKGGAADLVIEIDYGISPPIFSQKEVSEPVYADDGNGLEQYVGERRHLETVTTYEKHLLITARDSSEAKDNASPKPVWGVDVTSNDGSKDMREYLPILVAASIDYIGKDSDGEIKTINIQEKDPALAFVKKGL
jgi:hypothetical protein